MERGGITSSRQEETKRRRCSSRIVPFGYISIAVWLAVCFVVGIISFVSAFRSSGSRCLLSGAATRRRSFAFLQGERTGIALFGLDIHRPLGTSLQMESDNASESAARRTSTRRTKTTAANEIRNETTTPKGAPSKKEPTTKNTTKKRKPPVTKPSSSKSSKPTQKVEPKPANKRTKKPEPQRLTERDELPKLWNAQEALEHTGSYTFNIMSWNVAGLRAVMKNHPEALSDLVTKYNVDVLCLQETKLQEMHVDDPKLKINGHLLEVEGYDAHYSCSTTKKGYSGTAVFIKRRTTVSQDAVKPSSKKQATLGNFFNGTKTTNDVASSSNGGTTASLGSVDVASVIPQKVSCEMGYPEHDSEGRIIAVDFPHFSLANLYVPNSGASLDRLSYRTETWDTHLLEFMQTKEMEKPVIWLGDLNVAYTDMEVWNEGAKHLAKSAGTTPEERASFARQLDAGFVDAFRFLHPKAKGQYTYWSQRAGNRAPNKGLRLDYFICSKSLMEDDGDKSKVVVRDSFIVPDQLGSDHCPIVLELEIKK
mmetsp:Transcript_10851/g.19842  ORF Transcript_10851/g.19842 Transcript_10851/m.19842 type:complete len:537 (-) Transcript_10851:1097-2707(-)